MTNPQDIPPDTSPDTPVAAVHASFSIASCASTGLTADALLALNMAPGLGPVLLGRALKQLGGPLAVIQAGVSTLGTIPGIGPGKATAIRNGLDKLMDGTTVAKERQLMDQWGVETLFLGQDGYPKLLALTPDPPIVLYVRGQLLPQDAIALGVVGSRKCTAYGREQADRLSAWCAQAGLTIISGGAYGVDAAAHRAAMRVGGRTAVVLGSGIARPYPKEHAQLFDDAAAGGHAIISELPMTAPPRAEQFPRRNRLISGLSLGVLVVEAALRSGALITARLAAEDHGREVMALPGRVDSPASAGCHKIIRAGWASLVTSGQDILEALGEAGQTLQSELPKTLFDVLGDGGAATSNSPTSGASLASMNLSEEQKKMLAVLDKPLEVDQLATLTGLPVARLQAELTMLQIRGLVTRQAGKIARTHLR